MAKRLISIGLLVCSLNNKIFSQSFINKLRTPISIKAKLNLGYDSNFLRLSENEIKSDKIGMYGISSSLDSPIIKPSIQLVYTPYLFLTKQTKITSSISYSYYSASKEKSFFITNFSIQQKLKPYSWFKIGYRYIPKYYLRNYIDRDSGRKDALLYSSCSFFSQKYFISYSHPISFINKLWAKLYTDYTQEYYNPNFTEFNLDKVMIQLDLNYYVTKRNRIKFSLSHGKAKNINYNSQLSSTQINRSYIFDKMSMVFLKKFNNDYNINELGLSIIFEQRYYELDSKKYFIDNWKYYLDGKYKLWFLWDFFAEVDLKTLYHYRWRDADTQLYGDFEWVEDSKSYSKHEFWIELSYNFNSNFLY